MASRWIGWAALGLVVGVGCSEDEDSSGGTDDASSAGGTQASGAAGGTGGSSTTSNGGSSNGGSSNGGSSNGGSSNGGSSPGGSAGAGGEPQCPEPPLTQSDLFACDAPLSCPALCAHLGYGDCGGDVTCGAELLASTDPGLLLLESRPGPGNARSDTLTLLLAGGGAIRQTRSQWCDEFPCDFDAIPWQITQQELCDVYPFRTCDSCDPYPVTVNCAPLLSELSCADLEQALEGETELNLGEGEACHESDDPNCESSYSFVLTADAWAPGIYEFDVDQEDARLLCEVELVELSSARGADRSAGEAGSAGAGGAAAEEELALYVGGRSCEIIENSGGVSDTPSFEFDGGIVVRIPNRDSVELEVRDTEGLLLSQSIAPSTGCQVPEVPVTD